MSSSLGMWYWPLLVTLIAPRLMQQILQVWLFQWQRIHQHAVLPSRKDYSIVLTCTIHLGQSPQHQMTGSSWTSKMHSSIGRGFPGSQKEKWRVSYHWLEDRVWSNATAGGIAWATSALAKRLIGFAVLDATGIANAARTILSSGICVWV